MSYSDDEDEYGQYFSEEEYGGSDGDYYGRSPGEDYPVVTEYAEEVKDDPFETAVEIEGPRLVADFEQIQMTSSSFGQLGTTISGGEYDRDKKGRKKLLNRLNIISASPEQRFEYLLLQDMRDYKGRIPEKYFEFVGGLVQQGLIPNYGRYNPLAMAMSLYVLNPDLSISEQKMERAKTVITKFSDFDLPVFLPGMLKYIRWWKNFMQENPFSIPA